MLKHANISIFVPNNGCPHMCSFCDQFKITGALKQPTVEDIRTAVSNSKIDSQNQTKLDYYREIAFFGGSFTAIDRNYMEILLSCAYEYVKNGEVQGIRISTRPDCIDEEILKLLKFYGVTAIELGAQSMSDSVLTFNNRGHTSEDIKYSSNIIKAYGFELGLQMMTGLYISSKEDDIYTANQFIKLMPDTVRIYPTIVMKGTKLEKLYHQNKYIPSKINDAVELCSYLLGLFEKSNIRVIRVGLHSSRGIDQNFVAGPWHPAFRELCESKILVKECMQKIKDLHMVGEYIQILVCEKDISKIIGQKKCGINEIKTLCPAVKIKSDRSLLPKSLIVKELKTYEVEVP